MKCKTGGFKLCAFKFNLCRYNARAGGDRAAESRRGAVQARAVGLCTLNSFDPYPITYSLSNP
jgi:hypothetical protein